MEIRIVEPNRLNKWNPSAKHEATVLVTNSFDNKIWLAKIVAVDEDDLWQIIEESFGAHETAVVIELDELKKAIKAFEDGD